MARLSDLLKNANKMDLYRVANQEKVPKRGKKKHISQMSKQEQDYLFTKLKSIKKWSLSTHALDRLVEKGIEAKYDDLVSTIHNATIVEYHVATLKNDFQDARVLLASNDVVNKNYILKVVYSISRKKIVSVWINHVNDKHKTLDMKDYNKNIKILGV